MYTATDGAIRLYTEKGGDQRIKLTRENPTNTSYKDGLETAAGPIATQMVVDASGATRWLGRALGVSSPARSPRLIARATATGKDRVQPMMTRLLWSETSPDGPGAPEPLSMDADFVRRPPGPGLGPAAP